MRTDGCSRRYCAARQERMVLYKSWYTGEYLIAAIKKMQHNPFEARHNIARQRMLLQLKRTETYEWVRAR